VTTTAVQTFTESLTLLPATPKVLTFDLDKEGVGAPLGFYLTLNNTGGNPINTILWERSAFGNQYVTDLGYAAAAGTSLAAGIKVSLEDYGLSSRYLRITLTSTLGTTCELRMRVSRS